MKHTITVLQDDIDNGRNNNPFECAVARAVSRELPLLPQVSVTSSYLWFGELDRRQRACFPSEVGRFVIDFDSGLPVEPFKFEIELPDPK